jgi:hypothetical protein
MEKAYKLGINTKKNCIICNTPISKIEWAAKVLDTNNKYTYMHLTCDEDWVQKHLRNTG